MLVFIVIAVAAYLLGSIPAGYLVAKAKGIDIRAVGSGNIGATNVLRTGRRDLALITLIGCEFNAEAERMITALQSRE